MRIAIVVAVFVILCAAGLVGVVAPASGQTVPPVLTPMPTPDPLTPQPGCNGWCMPGPTPVPNIPPPNIPPQEPTAEVAPAFPGMPTGIGYLVFCPAVGRGER